jgi:hypothetical protein
LLEGKFQTAARAPRSEPLKLKETRAEMSVIEQSVRPFVTELSTLTSMWLPALPFGLMTAAVPPTGTIHKYSVTFEEMSGVVGNTPVFVLRFFDGALVKAPPATPIRPFLLDDESGFHIVSTWEWRRDLNTATFWLRSDVIESMKPNTWHVSIFRTDNWRTPSKPVSIKQVVDTGEAWT